MAPEKLLGREIEGHVRGGAKVDLEDEGCGQQLPRQQAQRNQEVGGVAIGLFSIFGFWFFPSNKHIWIYLLGRDCHYQHRVNLLLQKPEIRSCLRFLVGPPRDFSLLAVSRAR